MLNCLDQVRIGQMRPETFQRAEMTRRALNFSLSSTAIIEPVFSAAVYSLDVDLSGRYLLSGAGDGTWYIHDTFNLSGEMDHKKRAVAQSTRRVGHKRGIGTVEWYPSDNGLFVTSCSEGTLCIWDANNTTRPVDVYELDEGITRHQINPNCGTQIAACSDGQVSLIDVRSGSAIQQLPDTFTRSKEVAWNPKHQHQLMVGSEGGHLIEWDIRSTLFYRGYGLKEVTLVKRGVRTRDFREQVSVLQKGHSGAVCSIKYSKDGMEFYSFGGDGYVRRWMSDTSFSTEPLVCSLKYGKKPTGHPTMQIGVVSDADPPLVFVPKATSIAVCDMKNCKVQKELIGHFKIVNCFVYDDQYLQGYSGGGDSAVMVWSGNRVTEQTYLEEKLKGNPTPGKRAAAANAQLGLISLLDEDDDYDEYEVGSEPEFDDAL